MIDSPPAPFRQQHKIVPVSALPAIRERHRGARIVLCHGAFDLVHMGHLIHFDEARSLGDLLVVTITADAYITKKRAVSFGQEYRARQLAALQVVDYVSIIDEPSAVTPIEALHPDVYVKGPEYANLVLDKSANIFREKAIVESYGGRIHFTTGETFSSTKLSHFLLASPEAAQGNPLLRNDRVLFRDLSSLGFTLDDLKGFLAAAAKLRVCLLGETIIDEWVDVTVTNLSIKSRCVAGLETARSRQIGGAGVIALHLAGFVEHVHCVTNGLSEPLPPNVCVTRLADDLIVKTRFVDRMFSMLKPRALSVTDGEHGVMVRRADDVFELPTLSTSVVDTIGCGDAYFALSSLAAAIGCPIRIVALAGSVGAAAVAQRRGNESPTSEQEFLTIGKIVI